MKRVEKTRLDVRLYGRKDRLHAVTVEFDSAALDAAHPGQVIEMEIVEVQRIGVER